MLESKTLQTIDIQHNKIDDPAVVDILEQLPDLRVVYLQGNPVVKKIPHYRKSMVYRLKMLKYLDDRPVFDEERRRCVAWYEAFLENGVQAAQTAERAEIDAIREEKRSADERNFRAMEEMMKNGLEIRRKREEAEARAVDAAASAVAQANDDAADGEAAAVTVAEQPATNVFSGEAIVDVPESDEVRAAREARLAKVMAMGTGADASALPPPIPPASTSASGGDVDGENLMPPAPPTEDAAAAQREADIRSQKLAAICADEDLEELD